MTRISYGWDDYPQYKEFRPWLIWALGMHGWFQDRVQMRYQTWYTCLTPPDTWPAQTNLGNRLSALLGYNIALFYDLYLPNSSHFLAGSTFLHPTSSLFYLVYLILPDLVLAYITSHFDVGFRNWLGWAVPSHRGRGFLSILSICILPIHNRVFPKMVVPPNHPF